MNSKSGQHEKTSRVWEKSFENLISRLHSKVSDQVHRFLSAAQQQKLVVQQTPLVQNRFLFSGWIALSVYPPGAAAQRVLLEIRMFTDKKFCDVKLAIGALVVLGFQCRWEVVQEHSRVIGTIIVETKDGTKRIGTFRDGSSFVVKVRLVQDILDTIA